jgi:hypothetical protein
MIAGGHVTGTVDAPVCVAFDSKFVSPSGVTCQN